MNFTNYTDHPGDNRYLVFHFWQQKFADEFEKGITERDVVFERYEEEENGKIKYYFGISKSYSKDAHYVNRMLHAEHRKPFIPIKGLRYFVLILTLIFVVLGIIGYLKLH